MISYGCIKRKDGHCMNILHLKYAVEVARTKSISKAADNLYMGQPNLSRAIKELEESIGITIFRRTSKGITTTADGDEFLRIARNIVAQVDEVEDMYRSRRSHKQTFSICIPRASYISAAITEFSKHISLSDPAEIFYKETNAGETLANVVRGDYNLGIVRYQTAFEKHFTELFKEKKLVYETAAEFNCRLLIQRGDPLAKKTTLSPDDLADYIEVTYGDPYVPSLPLIDVRKSEITDNVDKRIFIYDRAATFEVLSSVPKTFMWVSPIPRATLDKHGLTVLSYPDGGKAYKDVLIYRRDYKLSDYDKQFITELCDSKRGCF